jgi:hypothetical protein
MAISTAIREDKSPIDDEYSDAVPIGLVTVHSCNTSWLGIVGYSGEGERDSGLKPNAIPL